MNNSKGYNQILFITTLSVYLGLVLVGASPQVLAQAALTSKFDIKDQIEKQYDLDKKPDEQTQEFIDQYEEFVTDLARNESPVWITGFRISRFAGAVSAETSFDKLPVGFESRYLFCGLNSNDLVAKVKPNLKVNNINRVTGSSDFADTLTRLFKKSRNEPKRLIVQNTIVTSADNQVIISTRLPRGSIDSLLKQ